MPAGPTTRERWRHVFWVGGGSGAGKSTIARRLAARYGLRILSTDDAMADHGRRCAPEACPALAAFREMSMDERWVHGSPQAMLDTFHSFRGEGFHLVLEDLLDLPAERGIVIEGFRLLPRLVAPHLADRAHAVWLLPTPAFRVAAFESRGTLWSIAGKTSDLDRALRNLLERDRLFTDRLRQEVAAAGLAMIAVDESIGEEALEERVASHFGLGPTSTRASQQESAVTLDRKHRSRPPSVR